MKLLKKIAAALLCVCTVFSFAACSDTSWVLEYDGSKMNAGVYLAYELNAYYNAVQKADTSTMTSYSDVLKQTIEEKSAKDWIAEETLRLCNQHVAVANKFDELGLTLTPEHEVEIDNSLNIQWSYFSELYTKNGIAEESYRELLISTKKKDLIFEAYYSDGGIEGVKLDELKDSFYNNTLKINQFGMTYGNALSEEAEDEIAEENAKQREEAAKWLEQFISGEITFNEAKDAYEHYIVATEHDEEDVNDIIAADEKTIEFVGLEENYEISAETLKKIYDELEVGKAALYDDDGATYMVARYEITDDDFEAEKNQYLNDLYGEKFTEMVKEWTAATSPASTNTAAVNRYSPNKIKPE